MALGNKQVMADNIKRLLKQKGLNPRQMSIELGLKYTTVNDWVNAKTYPRIDKIEMMANFFNVTKSDLVEVYASDFGLSSDILTLERALNADNRIAWVDYGKVLLEKQTEVQEPLLVYDVATVSSLAAGHGFSYDDYDTKIVQVTNEPPAYDIASVVDGDSMTPNYQNGDVVYLRDKGISSYSGQVCAVVVNDKTYLKRVYTGTNCLRLVSINPAYDDIVIAFPPSGDTHIKIFAVIGSDRQI